MTDSAASRGEETRVVLVFNRPISDDELERIKATTDAVEVSKPDPTHHHDHDTKLA
jgi:hypothetical protein